MVSKVVVVSSVVVVGDSRVHSPHISNGRQLHRTRKNHKRVEIIYLRLQTYCPNCSNPLVSWWAARKSFWGRGRRVTKHVSVRTGVFLGLATPSTGAEPQHVPYLWTLECNENRLEDAQLKTQISSRDGASITLCIPPYPISFPDLILPKCNKITYYHSVKFNLVG